MESTANLQTSGGPLNSAPILTDCIGGSDLYIFYYLQQNDPYFLKATIMELDII